MFALLANFCSYCSWVAKDNMGHLHAKAISLSAVALMCCVEKYFLEYL